MQYEDKIRISTPEGVEMELPLAGIGSRLTARILDYLIQGAALLILVLLLSSSFDSSSASEALVAIVSIVGTFAVIWIYDVAFETFGGGRTPGKRAVGIRVVGDRGEPIDLASSAVRNLLRLIDEFLTLWLVALVSILRSDKNQRVGDMAGGALVVRERTSETRGDVAIGIANLGDIEAAATWDTTAVTDEELATARRFLERRTAVEPQARARLAADIRARLQPKVPGSEGVSGAEKWVELLVAAKSRRG